jgi:segregation and condensation protein B
MENIKHILESLLFVTEAPLTLERLKSVLETADSAPIRQALQQLAQEYEERRGGFYLREVAGGYQICTRPEYNEWIKRLISPNPARLSRAALETLAIVAYKQPIIRSDVEHIRGVDSGGVLRQLLERKLIRILGRKEIPGRPLIYATTKEFLATFDLKDLKDLPTLNEIDAFGKAAPQEIPAAEAEPAAEISPDEQPQTDPEEDFLSEDSAPPAVPPEESDLSLDPGDNDAFNGKNA